MRYHQSSIKAMQAEPPRKTQTRRVQNEGEILVYAHRGRRWERVYQSKPTGDYTVPTILDKHGRIKWQVGRRYAIQRGRGKEAIGSYLCTSLRGERLQDISRTDVIAEGIAPYTFARGVLSKNPPDRRWAFIDLWDSLHKEGERWVGNPSVWIIGMGDYQWEGK